MTTHGWRLQFTANGLDAQGVTLRMLLCEAYALYDKGRIAGGPDWLDETRFDVTAKIDSDDVAKLADLPLETRRAMLQQLLKDRFGVKAHHEDRPFPVFDLVIAPGGPKLKAAVESVAIRGRVKGYNGLITRSRSGQLTYESATMKSLAGVLSGVAGRVVLDKTYIEGIFDVVLDWSPESLTTTASADSGNGAPPLPKAIKEQLGLKLKPATEPLDVVVVDHAEQPTPN